MKKRIYLRVAVFFLGLFMFFSLGYGFCQKDGSYILVTVDWIHENKTLFILSGGYNFTKNRFYVSTPSDEESPIHIIDGITGEDLGTSLTFQGLTFGSLNIFGLCIDDSGVIYGGTNTTPYDSLIRWENESALPTQKFIPFMGLPRVMDIKRSGIDSIIAVTGKTDNDAARLLETVDGTNFYLSQETAFNLGKHGIALGKTGQTVYLTQGNQDENNLFNRVDNIEGHWTKNPDFVPPLDQLNIPCPLGYFDEGNVVFCISTQALNEDHLYALDGDTGAIMDDIPLGIDVAEYGYGAIDLQADGNGGKGAFVMRRYPSGFICGRFHFTFTEPTPTPIPSPTPQNYPFLGQIKPGTDFWGATCPGVPPFGEPYLRALLGFRFDPLNNWMPLSGNANGSGPDDLIQITEYGDAWVSVSLNNKNLEGKRWGWLGFKYVEQASKGWMPLNGDVNGDGADDLIQVTEYGDAWAAISTESAYSAPSRWRWLGYRFNRGAPGENGALPLAGDANGDGLCDLIQVTEYRDAWVALSTETMYNSASRWGYLGFKYAPFDGWYPLCGDVNADGADDLIQITPTGDPWVSLSTESTYASPTRWGRLNFYYDEAQGYYPLVGDVNTDGKADLIQITPSGEALVAPSTGTSFDSPEHWGWLGFLFDRDQGHLPLYMDY